jgi:hypothetical protein
MTPSAKEDAKAGFKMRYQQVKAARDPGKQNCRGGPEGPRTPVAGLPLVGKTDRR